ncbi:MAG TPA: hypothetical protein VNL74_08385 [Methylococcus sp.]|nr:hypothetical protein [Methylococcus sp.]
MQSTLFDQEVAPERIFLLTNRYNLLEILASGLVQPLEGFTKYYRDLLELSPGRIPLIGHPFPTDLVTLVSSEDATAFPVAIELDPDVIGPGTPVMSASAPDGLGEQAWAPTGAIPLARAVAIHFRTNAELDEHLSRDYGNVRQADDRYRVSPELYSNSSAPRSDLLDWLRSLERPPSMVPEGIDPDRIGGAIALMASLCPPDREAIETLRRCLDGDRNVRGRRRHAKWLVAAMRGRRSRNPTEDEILFRAAVETFAAADVSHAWRAVEALSAVWNAAAPNLAVDDQERLKALFDRIRQILQGELPFERLRPHGPPSVKALLLALLRPDPERLATWPAEETGADWSVVLASAALVGALRGRRRMATNLRLPELDDLLAWQEATSRNSAAEATVRFPHPPAIRLADFKTGSGRRLKLMAGTSLLASWDVREPERAGGPDSAEGTPARWDAPHDKESEAALIDLCDQLGWDDCTWTVIDASTALEAVEPNSTRYRVAGRVSVRRTVDAEAFRTRLESAQISSEQKERAALLLEALPSPQPDAGVE